MLHPRTSNTGVVFYVSPLLERIGVPHAFSTRRGGVSSAPFDSMNLGNPNGCEIQDEKRAIEENYHLLQSEIRYDRHALCRVHQVHGNHVKIVEAGKPLSEMTRPMP